MGKCNKISVFKLVLCMLLLVSLAGCGGVFNPYDSKSIAQQYAFPGVPETPQEAYFDSRHNIYPARYDKKWVYSRLEYEKKYRDLIKAREEVIKKETQDNPIDYSYRAELFKTIKKELKQPDTPLVIPPKVVRALILPAKIKDTKGDDVLVTSYYVYFFLDRPQWILAPYGKLPDKVNDSLPYNYLTAK